VVIFAIKVHQQQFLPVSFQNDMLIAQKHGPRPLLKCKQTMPAAS